MSVFNRLLASRKGAAAIEFAIIAPLFFMCVLTLIAYGIYLSAAHSIQQVAAMRRGLRLRAFRRKNGSALPPITSGARR
ncbi:putative membrane protein [Sinorhizobium meliloti Rm41]|nr:putative membrane protein [Sinorhizobium meliloti Rm41]